MFGHYLIFNRNCEEALAAYAKAFGGIIGEMQKYGDMPPDPSFPIADDDKNLVLHARLALGDMELMCADSLNLSESGENMYVAFTSKDVAAVTKAWDILKAGGEIYMDIKPSFFAALHGSLKDKFGVNWMFTALK